jgi:hypothetical protein
MKLTLPEVLIVTLVAIGIFVGVCNLRNPVQAPVTPDSGLDALMDAIEWKESKCDSQARGDFDEETKVYKAIGAYQLWKIMVRDVNRILGYDYYTYQDRYDRVKSRDMCEIFLEHYCKDMSDFDKARCWNGGPKGYTKDSTIEYGNDVMDIMEDRAK